MASSLPLNLTACTDWLQSQGLSKHKLERAVGIPRYYWSRWARGQRVTRVNQQRLLSAGAPASVFKEATSV